MVASGESRLRMTAPGRSGVAAIRAVPFRCRRSGLHADPPDTPRFRMPAAGRSSSNLGNLPSAARCPTDIVITHCAASVPVAPARGSLCSFGRCMVCLLVRTKTAPGFANVPGGLGAGLVPCFWCDVLVRRCRVFLVVFPVRC
jgi:hypothetical protein